MITRQKPTPTEQLNHGLNKLLSKCYKSKARWTVGTWSLQRTLAINLYMKWACEELEEWMRECWIKCTNIWGKQRAT